MDIIKLGKITAPQGIKGEVRVYPYTDKPTRFSEIEAVLLNGRRCRIEKARYMKNMAILKLEGIDDRNAAETMRNRELLLDYVPKINFGFIALALMLILGLLAYHRLRSRSERKKQ